jgi:hypothetical protein
MKKTQRSPAPTNQVMALYTDRTRSFRLNKGATFADLADRLDQPRVHAWHEDMPTAIYLRFAMNPQSRGTMQTAI